MEKEQLVQIIKEWVKNDNEMRVLQSEIKKRKVEKQKYTARLIDIMSNNTIDCFDINDGQILFKTKNSRQSITKTTLLEILSTFYQGDKDKATELNTYIMDSRKIVTKNVIVRKIATPSEPPSQGESESSS